MWGEKKRTHSIFKVPSIANLSLVVLINFVPSDQHLFSNLLHQFLLNTDRTQHVLVITLIYISPCLRIPTALYPHRGSMRPSGVTHCVGSLWRGRLLFTWRPLCLFLLGLFSALRLLTLTTWCSQLLVLLWRKHLFGFMAVQVFLKPDGLQEKGQKEM